MIVHHRAVYEVKTPFCVTGIWPLTLASHGSSSMLLHTAKYLETELVAQGKNKKNDDPAACFIILGINPAPFLTPPRHCQHF